jgi:phospholipase/lecithinase/hemolysin
MQEDGKTMQERLEIILREGRLLAADAGHRVASVARSAYHDVLRRFGWEHEAEAGLAQEAEDARQARTQAKAAPGETTPEGYAAGQLWQPRDPSKKSRRINAVKRQGADYIVVWQSPQGGAENEIKEASFTRWVRREHASLKT